MSTILLPIFFCSLRCWHCFVASFSLLVWSLNQSFHMETNFSNSNKNQLLIVASKLHNIESLLLLWVKLKVYVLLWSAIAAIYTSWHPIIFIWSEVLFLFFVFGTKDGLSWDRVVSRGKINAVHAVLVFTI
jgi:hypothetical protein